MKQRAPVKAIWDVILNDDVRDLIRKIRQRCEGVMAANWLLLGFN
jgi:hypothetical protein